MNNKVERCILFSIAIPLSVVIPLFVSFFHQLFLALLAMICLFLAHREFFQMVKPRELFSERERNFHLIVSFVTPLLFYLSTYELISFKGILLYLFFMVLIALSAPVFAYQEGDDPKSLLIKMSLAAFFPLYFGFLGGFFIYIPNLDPKGAHIILFLLFVFLNDSTAYLGGMLFGKNNRNILAISPKKSVAGYFSGLFGLLVIATAAKLIFPTIFEPTLLEMLFAGTIIAILCDIGDLIESAFKRSCETKDSGSAVLGRGGMLDSLDSLLVAAPAFYYFFS